MTTQATIEASRAAGFADGNRAGGTHNYNPRNRKAHGSAWLAYSEGFAEGNQAYRNHPTTILAAQQAAWLQQPRATRGPRPI